MDLTVTFLGTSAALPTAERGLAATVVRRGGLSVLVDCGEGTQRQLRRSALGLIPVDAVLFTHLHGDHCLGLIGLLKTYDLLGRTEPLELCGPVGLHSWVDTVAPLVGRVGFDVTVHEVTPGQSCATSSPAWQIRAFATTHSVPSVGWRFEEATRPGVFDIGRAAALGLRPGPDFGTLQRGGTVEHDGRTVRPEDVLGPPRPGRLVVLTGDTEPCEGTLDAARGADLLVHEATFSAADRERARLTRHSCADEAAQLAAAAGVRRLALTHLSQRLTAADIHAEAAPSFPGVTVPDDLTQYEVPHAPA